MLTFAETRLFTKLVQEYLSDDEYAKLQQALVVNPKRATSSLDLEASGSCAGLLLTEVSAAAFG